MADIIEAQESSAAKHLDTITGEYVSKSELKRREKQRTKEREIAEKVAKLSLECNVTGGAQANGIVKKKPQGTEEDEEDIDPNKYYENRSHLIGQMKRDGLKEVYPHKFQVSMTLPEFIEKYQNLDAGQHLSETVSLSGRLFSKRSAGAKLIFYDLRNEHQKVQIMAQAQ